MMPYTPSNHTLADQPLLCPGSNMPQTIFHRHFYSEGLAEESIDA